MNFERDVIGKVIRSLRLRKGVSQEVLSGFVPMARTHLTMIENGNKLPNFETVWKIAHALDLSPHDLVSKIEEELSKLTK